jgi:hypothetical protein
MMKLAFHVIVFAFLIESAVGFCNTPSSLIYNRASIRSNGILCNFVPLKVEDKVSFRCYSKLHSTPAIEISSEDPNPSNTTQTNSDVSSDVSSETSSNISPVISSDEISLEDSSPSNTILSQNSTDISSDVLSQNSTDVSSDVNSDISFFTKVKNVLSGKGSSGLSMSKDSLSKLGLNVLLAYGFVSNVSYITCLILAWIAHGKSTGLSPLVPGQWKKFLLVYATFFAANNILRPLRFSLSLVITPAFDKLIDLIQEKTKWTRRSSTGITIFLVNVCGTFTYLFLGLFLATTLAKVPLFPAKVPLL